MDAEPPDLMTDRPHSARVYDYMLGGKDNYAADRAAADAIVAAHPATPIAARNQRAFMQRAARFLAAEGIDQFLDIGTGIPTEPNLHQIVQEIRPAARVVYVDNDPIVLAHAAALLVGTPEGRTAFLHADARDPAAIRASDQVRDHLDPSRPLAVLTVGILHFFTDEVVRRLIATLLGDAAPGSALAFSQATEDADTDGTGAAAVASYKAAGIDIHTRTRAEIEQLVVADMQLVEPGIAFVHRWRQDAARFVSATDSDIGIYGAVARVPG